MTKRYLTIVETIKLVIPEGATHYITGGDSPFGIQWWLNSDGLLRPTKGWYFLNENGVWHYSVHGTTPPPFVLELPESHLERGTTYDQVLLPPKED